ncbi:MAG: MBL fold metallo-hydrolase [Candidatus Thorarchaeota archaeon]
MKYLQVTDTVVLLNNDFGANISCIALKDELFYIDTSMNTTIAADFRKEMEQKFNCPSTELIITHGHIDHLFGIGAFKGLDVIVAEDSKPRFERFVNTEYTEEVIANISRVFPFFRESVKSANLFMPNIWVKDQMNINEEILFQVVGGHSACSSTIFYKPDKMLFVGDLVQYNSYPYFGEPDNDMFKWIANLKKWEELDIDIFIPGHGIPFNKIYLKKVRIFFEELVAFLKEMKQQKIPEEEVPYHPNFPKGYWDETAVRRPPFDFSVKNLYRIL